MTAVERIERMVVELGDGVAICDKHDKASTANTDVRKMLSATRHELQNVLIEIHKGNVK